MAFIPNSNSVVAFQSNSSSLLTGASIIGLTPVAPTPSSVYVINPVSTLSITTGNSSVQLVNGVAVIGSVAVLQGTSPWLVNVPTPSYISYQAAGSIMAVSGSFTSTPQGSIIATQLAGSIMAVNVPTSSYISYQLAGSILAVSGSFSSTPQSSIIATQIAGSVLAVNVPTSSYISYQAAGSIMAVSGTFTSGNTSVQLLAGVATIGSVAVLQGTSPWLVNMPSPSIVIITPAGSVQGVRTDNASVIAVLSNSSVTALQGTNPWIVAQNNGSITGTYQEKSATVASAIGVAFLFKNNTTTSTLATVSTTDPLPVQGSVTALQGTNPWIVNATGSIAAALQSTNASVMVIEGTYTRITSVMNTLPSSMMVGASIFGTVPVTQTTSPWVVNMPSPSMIMYQLAGSILQVTGGGGGTQYLENTQAASVTGTAMMYKSNLTTSILTVVTPATPLPASVQGTVALNQGVSSVFLMAGVQPIGSVATLQGTNPWIVNVPTPSYLSIQPGGSVLNANISGSVAAVFTTGNSSVQLISTSASIATLVNNILTGNSSVQLISTSASIMVNNRATFGNNNAWTQTDSVVSMGWVRNDTMSSITAGDLRYSGGAVGPVGENIVSNSPITKWVVGRGSVLNGTSIQVLAAPGASIFTYITGINVINESATASRITLTQGLGAVPASMLTWLIAPAGGGSNSTYINPIRVLDNLGVSASISTVASVYVTITGFNAKT